MLERTVFESISHRHLVSVAPSASVLEAVWVMTADNGGSVLVIDKHSTLKGILTEHDLLTRVLARGLDPKLTSVSAVMTQSPHTVEPEVKVAEAILVMMEHGIGYLPVVSSVGKILGVFSGRDALPPEIGDAASLAEFNEQVNDALA
jgi:signal-transduction protein with cAMP-binding, CBS, and nucleotidyltransferase domain